MNDKIERKLFQVWKEAKSIEYVKIIDYSFFVYSIWFSKTNFFNSKTKKR